MTTHPTNSAVGVPNVDRRIAVAPMRDWTNDVYSIRESKS
jgi:hypothetical protein